MSLYHWLCRCSQVQGRCEHNTSLEVFLCLFELCLQVCISYDLRALDELGDQLVKSPECSDYGAFVYVPGLITELLEVAAPTPERGQLHQVRLELTHVLVLVKGYLAFSHHCCHSVCHLLQGQEGLAQLVVLAYLLDSLCGAFSVCVDQT